MRTLSFDAIRLVLQNSSSKVSRTSHRRPMSCSLFRSSLSRPDQICLFRSCSHGRLLLYRGHRGSVFPVHAVERRLLFVCHSWTREPQRLYGDLELLDLRDPRIGRMHGFPWLSYLRHVAKAVSCEHPMVVFRGGNICTHLGAHSPRRPVVGEDYSALRRPRTAHHVNAWDRAPNPSRTRFHLPCAAKAFFITPSLRRYLGWDGFLHPRA